MPNGKMRMYWVDSLRFFACMAVFVVHFCSLFAPSLLKFWSNENSPVFFTPYILKLANGKVAVAMFCVLLGYFAMAVQKNTYEKYVASRYLQLAMPLLLVNTVMVAGALLLQFAGVQPNPLVQMTNSCLQNAYSLSMLLRDSLLFETAITSTYWCIRPFFIASCLIAVLQRLMHSRTRVFKLVVVSGVYVVLLLAESVWLANCLLGAIGYLLLEGRKLPVWARCIIVVAVPFLYMYKESFVGYILFGWAMLGVFAVCHNTGWLQRVLSVKPLAKLGQYALGVYLWHVPVFRLFTYFVMGALLRVLPNRYAVILVFFLSLVVTLVCAALSQKCVAWVRRKVGERLKSSGRLKA